MVDEIDAVNQQIAAVEVLIVNAEKEISEVEGRLRYIENALGDQSRASEHAKWEKDLVYYRDKESKLRDKESKLRDEKSKLRDEKSKLRDEKNILLQRAGGYTSSFLCFKCARLFLFLLWVSLCKFALFLLYKGALVVGCN
eukprot:Opistho-2@61393